MFSLIRTTATMNAWHDKVNPYSCHLKNTAVNWSSEGEESKVKPL